MHFPLKRPDYGQNSFHRSMKSDFPRAIELLEDGLEDSLAFYAFP